MNAQESQPDNSKKEELQDEKEKLYTAMDYFNMMFPIMMSMGYGGAVVAFAY